MTQAKDPKRPLEVSQPNIAEGKNGAELRGVFWREPSPEMSWFAMEWDAADRILAVEFYSSSITSELKAMVESALEGVVSSAAVGGSPNDVNLVSRQSIPSGQEEGVSKKLAEVLGAGWEQPIARLLATEPRTNQQRRSVMWYGIPREQIQWYPIIDPGRCDGCGKCTEFCKNDVLRLSGDPPGPRWPILPTAWSGAIPVQANAQRMPSSFRLGRFCRRSVPDDPIRTRLPAAVIRAPSR